MFFNLTTINKIRWVFILLFTLNNYSQQKVINTPVDNFVGVDIYDNIYYTQNKTLHKKELKNEYLNLKYGEPNSIDISNPLQILLLYTPFNKVVLLDNKLNFISEFNIPFGSALIANAGKNKIWIYNNINSTLSIFNFNTQKTEAKSIPITSNVIKLKGNLNKASLIKQNKKLVTYNFLARETNSVNTENNQYSISIQKGFYLKNSNLFYHQKLILKNLTDIKTYEIRNDIFYFQKSNNIYSIQIPKI